MDTELNRLLAFMEQLEACGMDRAPIVARGYDFALVLCRAREEREARAGREISALQQSYIMDHAADLLKAAVDKRIERRASATIEYEHLGKLYKGIIHEVSEEDK